MYQVLGSPLGHHLKVGETFMTEINLDANLFRVYDSKNSMSVQNNSTYDIKSHKWRFYINNYSGTPSAFTLIESNLDEIKIDSDKVED